MILVSCSTFIKKTHAVSILQNDKFVITKKDSLDIDSVRHSNIKFDEANKNYSELIIDGGTKAAEFYGGFSNFRSIIHKKFKTNYKSKNGENIVNITLGKYDNVEDVKIIKFTDEYSKRKIIKILKMNDFKRWRSATINFIKVKYEFEFIISISDKNP